MTVDAADFNVPFEALLDRTAWLRKRLPGASEDIIVLPVPILPFASDSAFIEYDFGTGATPILQVEWTTVSGDGALFPIPNIPGFGRIRGAGARVLGQVGAHGTLPANMPKLQLLHSTLTGDGARELVAEQVDTSATIGAYETYHSILISGLTEPILEGPYYLKVIGESGSGATTAFRLGGLTVELSGA